MNAQIKRLVRDDTLSSDVCDQLDKNFQAVPSDPAPAAVSSDYTFKDNDNIDSLQVNATAAARTITLPSPTGNRRRRVIKTDASANTVTISGGSYLINGAVTIVLAAQYARVWVEPTGSGWLIIGS